MLYTEILGLLLQSWARDSNNVTESKGQEKTQNVYTLVSRWSSQTDTVILH